MKALAIGFLIVSSLVVAGNVIYLSKTTSDEVKAKCRQEKFDPFYENQRFDCWARKGR